MEIIHTSAFFWKGNYRRYIVAQRWIAIHIVYIAIVHGQFAQHIPMSLQDIFPLKIIGFAGKNMPNSILKQSRKFQDE